jgi:outer membrane protein assembly factor BamB
VRLSAFDLATGEKPWTKAKTSVDPTIRTHDSKPAYRDLELDADGRTIWAACVCDAVSGNPAKALVKLDTEGNHDKSWLPQAGKGAFGESVVDYNGKLYLGPGAATSWASSARREATPAAGCATRPARRRRWRSWTVSW